MPQMRTLLFTLASSSALYPGAAMALGLGEITLYSALNQPLDARIELIDANQLDTDEFKVRLASEQAFARAGVERFYLLNDLRFTPVLRGGERYVRVQSNKLMREPYLNFLVEVVRPNGHFVREFTVLFDPPESSAYRQQAAPLTSLAPRIEQPVRGSISVPQVVPAATRGERYQVRRGDSLWLIAKRLQQAGSTLTLQRLMEGMLALNPQAFMGGDASRLKADVELLLPDEARPFTPAESPAPVVDAAVETLSGASVEVAGAVALPQPVPAPQSTADTQAVAQLQQRLDNELQANQQQNAELMAQLLTLSQQLNSLQQAVSQRDQQIAELEQRLQQAAPTPAAVDHTVVEAPAVEPAPAPVPGGISAETPSTWHWWLASSLLLGALVTAGWLRRGKRKNQAAAPAPTPQAAAVSQKPQHAASLPPLQSEPEQLAPAVPARNSDALVAANVYIAYGNFSEARACLRQALEQEPGRHELRLRLLEVLAQLGDEVGFKRELAVLQAIPECATPLARIREQYAQQFGAKPAEVVREPVAPLNETSPLLDDDFKLNLEDLPLDADWDQIEPFQPVRPVSKSVEEDSLIGSNLNELPEVCEMERSELSELPQVFERRGAARPAVVEADEGGSPWAREPVSKTLSDFRSFEDSHDLSYLEGKREHLSQLNQALAYIEQGNLDEACNILNQLISDGSDEQKREAQALLSRIA